MASLSDNKIIHSAAPRARRQRQGLFTAHELNSTDPQQVDPVTRRVYARQRHDLIGCSETGTVSAQTAGAL